MPQPNMLQIPPRALALLVPSTATRVYAGKMENVCRLYGDRRRCGVAAGQQGRLPRASMTMACRFPSKIIWQRPCGHRRRHTGEQPGVNETRTISLGIGQIMPVDAADQPTGLTRSIRDCPDATLANCTLIARRTLQGMARVRSGQAAAWPLVFGRRRHRGSAVNGGRRPFPEGNAKAPLTVERCSRTLTTWCTIGRPGRSG